MLISLYIRDELSYDRAYPNGDRIYRLVHEFDNNGKTGMGVSFAAPLAAALKADFPEVEKSGRLIDEPLFYGAGSNLVGKNDGGEGFANMYADVERTGGIFTSFAILAIVIACLGLFALSSFMAEQRSKEISIRKVLDR